MVQFGFKYTKGGFGTFETKFEPKIKKSEKLQILKFRLWIETVSNIPWQEA